MTGLNSAYQISTSGPPAINHGKALILASPTPDTSAKAK